MSKDVYADLLRLKRDNKDIRIKIYDLELAVYGISRNGPRLTRRQFEVMSNVKEGYDNHEIADRMNISSRTVESYIENITKLLGARSFRHAVALACDRELA